LCLLHTHPADTAFDEADIRDFYIHNSDGLGVMWSENDILYTHKYLPPNASAAWEFYKEHIRGRECVVHWRMKTHGEIDLENCHPYPIFGAGAVMPMSLMHNGILSIGNAADVTKSDTWHYVVDYLRPLLADHPDMFNNRIVMELLEEHIGHGNRFVIMNHKGETVILNKDDFVSYKGALLSNTYAWSSVKGGYGYTKTRKSVSLYDDEYWWQDYPQGRRSNGQSITTTPTTTAAYTKPLRTNEQIACSEFFQLLRERGFNRAYNQLSFSEVSEVVVENSGPIWTDFTTCVGQDLFTDDDIIQCMRDVDGRMLPMLYGGKLPEADQTEGDLHKKAQEAERKLEQDRLNDELLAMQTRTNDLVATLGAN